MPRLEPVPEVISVKIPSRLDLLAVLDSVTCAVCERMKFDEDATSQVSTSVIEAGTNAIQHGHHKDPALDVDVRFALFDDRIEIDVYDTGPGFDPEQVNGDVTGPDHLFEARGRGIFIMRACMDSVDFEFTPRGTVCRLVKHRPAARAAG